MYKIALCKIYEENKDSNEKQNKTKTQENTRTLLAEI